MKSIKKKEIIERKRNFVIKKEQNSVSDIVLLFSVMEICRKTDRDECEDRKETFRVVHYRGHSSGLSDDRLSDGHVHT